MKLYKKTQIALWLLTPAAALFILSPLARVRAPGGETRMVFLSGDISLKQQVKEIVNEHGEPWPVIKALISVESSWNPVGKNINGNGTVDHGLMQINSKTLKAYGIDISDAYDVPTNVRAGLRNFKECKMPAMRYMLDNKIPVTARNYTRWTIACYNAGPSRHRIKRGLGHANKVLAQIRPEDWRRI